MGGRSKKVWELVQSLDKGEINKFFQRAFQAKRTLNLEYVKVFKALREMDVYDHDELYSRLKGETFLPYLHRVKHYLYDRILEFIRNVDADAESELHFRLDGIKFLIEHRLYSHLDDQIARAVLMAEKIEDFPGHLKALDYIREYLISINDWKIFEEKIQSVKEKEDEIHLKVSEARKLTALRDRVMGATSRRSPEILNSIATDTEEGFQGLSLTAKVLREEILYYVAHFSAQYRKCIEHSDKIVDLIIANKDFTESYSNFKTFVMAVYYGSMFRLMFDEYDAAKKQIILIQEITNAKEREPQLYYERTTIFELAYARRTADAKALEEAVQNWDQLADDLIERMQPAARVEISHVLTEALICLKLPDKALKLIQSIDSIKPKTVRPDLRNFARIFYLIAHYELGNFDIVEKGIQSAKISFKRRKIMNDFHEGVFTLFSRLVRTTEKSAINEILQDFLDELEQKKHSPNWKSATNYFNMALWARSIVKDIRMIDQIQQQKDKQ